MEKGRMMLIEELSSPGLHRSRQRIKMGVGGHNCDSGKELPVTELRLKSGWQNCWSGYAKLLMSLCSGKAAAVDQRTVLMKGVRRQQRKRAKSSNRSRSKRRIRSRDENRSSFRSIILEEFREDLKRRRKRKREKMKRKKKADDNVEEEEDCEGLSEEKMISLDRSTSDCCSKGAKKTKKTHSLKSSTWSSTRWFLLLSAISLLIDCSDLSNNVGCQQGRHLSGERSRRGLPVLATVLATAATVTAAAAAAATQTVGAQELAEGLTLTAPGNPTLLSSSRLDQDAVGYNTQQQWPLQHLERIKSESKVSAQLGENVVLNCAVQFKDGVEKPFVVNWLKYPHKLPLYIWYAGYPPHVAQGYESRVARIGQASLNLSQVRQSDQGLYECKIYYLDRRPEDKGNGTWIYLDVQAPPHFTQVPAQVNYVQAGDSLRLTCQAESTPEPILRWYRHHTPIDSDAGAYRLSAATPTTTSAPGEALMATRLDLFIDNVQAGSTTGNYTCLASNSEGSVEARTQVVLAVPAVISTLPRNQTRLEGERTEMSCQAKALPSNITYKWLFNEKPIQTLKSFEGRHSVRRDGALVIQAVHRNDQGFYKCQATNGLAHRSRLPGTTSGTQVSSQQPMEQPAPIYAEAGAQLTVEYPARITHSPSVQYLPAGMSGQIRCFVAASPPVEFFTWTLNNQQFDPNTDSNLERLRNGSLLIRQVSKQYEGKYRCTPFNKHGSAGSSSAMEVRVEEPPRFELRPAEVYRANLGGQVRIPCDARGSPQPSISWRRPLSQHLPPISAATALAKANAHQLHLQQVLSPDEIPDSALPDDEHHHQHQQQLEATEVAHDQQQHQDNNNNEQQSVMSYAKLPSERAEYKNGHLQLHNLRKEDHGRYECVVENEVATLVAPTVLYIEETTPHAPTNLKAETKVWSVQLSWVPGYDGGFEQSFVIWYRQVDKPTASSGSSAGGASNSHEELDESSAAVPQTNSRLLPSPASPVPLITGVGSSEQRETLDFNWKSVNVQPSDATTFTVHNLSQDTSYEFYVRAKNIIGEGPRSPVLSLSTKKAISGAIASTHTADGFAAASTLAGLTANEDLDPTRNVAISVAPMNDEEESDGPTANPALVGIIHLVDLAGNSRPGKSESGGASSPNETANSDNQANSASSSESTQSNPLHSKTAPNSMLQSEDIAAGGQNSNKVIRILLPNKQQAAGGAGNHSSLDWTNKRPRFDQTDTNRSSSSNSSETSTQPAVPIDLSTAPQNVSMMKVAQGWVINWYPPQRLPTATDFPISGEPLMSSSSSQATQNHHLTALSQVVVTPSVAVPSPMPPLVDSEQQVSGLNGDALLASYSVEFHEKGSNNWQTLSGKSRERSLLLKDLKPGSEYVFRVFAHAPSGARGSPTPDFRYLIPDNRRKPGSTQALRAGIVSGVLFFIACIVIAVCAVNMCNKRRKKRAEKAAYVMMACPVLESHHDIAALNSNSLMKNGANTAQGRISGMSSDSAQGSSSAATAGYLSGNLSQAISATIADAKSRLDSFAHLFTAKQQPKTSVNKQQDGDHQVTGEVAQLANQCEGRRIEYTSNAPLPVDVPDDLVEHISSNSAALNGRQKSPSPIDHYWVRKPSDRKWGTLTLAASKLAERRAARQAGADEDSLAAECPTLGQSVSGAQLLQSTASSRTLPRSFGCSGMGVAMNDHAHQSFVEHQQQQQRRFSSWLQQQLAARTNNANSDINEAPQQQQQPGMLHSGMSPAVGQQQQQHQITQQLQHQQLHQRSMSQVESAALANFWLQTQVQRSPQHQQQQVMARQLSRQPAYWPHSLTNGANCALYQAEMGDYNDSSAVITQSSSGRYFEMRNSPARSTLPLANHSQQVYLPTQVCPFYPALTFTNSTALAASQQQQQHSDDPVTDNACLGSHKRKRRLPHIEAQFTITPPEPPTRHAPADGSHLFVRSLDHHQQQQQQLVSPKPRGLPQPGQRREQLRLRQQQPPPPPLDQMEPIGAREKIETYLRHSNQQTLAAQRGVGGEKEEEDEHQLEDSQQELTPPVSRSPIELDKLDELTFQPYHNLPSLRYTIKLPLEQKADGTLLLSETSHLRRSKRSIKSSSSATTDTSAATQTAHLKARPTKQRLGSSSSCPAPPPPSKSTTCTESASPVRASRYSLEGTLGKPSARRRAPAPPEDSLETLTQTKLADNSQVQQITRIATNYEQSYGLNATEQQQLHLNLQNNQEQQEEQQPFYLHTPSPTGTPDDYSSIRETREQLAPPPIPPHRSTTSGATTQRTKSNKEWLNSMGLPVQSVEVHSPSSDSSAESPSSTTDNCGPASEQSTSMNEQSVDENYEFDLVSSSAASSSLNQQQRQQVSRQKRRDGQRGASLMAALIERQVEVTLRRPEMLQLINGDLYTQVNKRRAPRAARNKQLVTTNNNTTQIAPHHQERSQLYDGSRRKQIQLSSDAHFQQVSSFGSTRSGLPAELRSEIRENFTSEATLNGNSSHNYYDPVYCETLTLNNSSEQLKQDIPERKTRSATTQNGHNNLQESTSQPEAKEVT